MTARLDVVQVPEGSVLLLAGVQISDDPSAMSAVMETIEQAVGHHRFCLVLADRDDASVEVWGPDDDLAAKVRELTHRPPCVFCGTDLRRVDGGWEDEDGQRRCVVRAGVASTDNIDHAP